MYVFWNDVHLQIIFPHWNMYDPLLHTKQGQSINYICIGTMALGKIWHKIQQIYSLP